MKVDIKANDNCETIKELSIRHLRVGEVFSYRATDGARYYGLCTANYSTIAYVIFFYDGNTAVLTNTYSDTTMNTSLLDLKYHPKATLTLNVND